MRQRLAVSWAACVLENWRRPESQVPSAHSALPAARGGVTVTPLY